MMQDPNQQQYPYPQQAPMPAVMMQNQNQNQMHGMQMMPMPQQGQPLVNNSQNQINNMQLCQSSEFPVQVYCNSCQQQVTTEIEYKRGSGTFCCCLLLTVFIGCCCCIPLFNKKCQDKIHNCPKCKCVFGVCEYKPINRKGRRNSKRR
ncbi:hypothetical protein ABPG72_000777 [Tetrahymena utriculariae]